MRLLRCVLALALLGYPAVPVRADAIDGEWCSKDGERLVINGPQVVTPDGRSTTGLYQRHSFTYEGLPGSAEAGQVIYLDLLHEDEVRLIRVKNGDTSPAQIWRRCQVISEFLAVAKSYRA